MDTHDSPGEVAPLDALPTRPEMLIDAILKIHDEIQDMKLGVNRKKQIAQQEQVALAAPSVLEMKGLMR